MLKLFPSQGELLLISACYSLRGWNDGALDASSKAMSEVLSQLKLASACLSDIIDDALAGNKLPKSFYKSLASALSAMEFDPEGLACGLGT